MTKNQIIEKLFTGKNFNDCLSKMEPAHLRDDLKQEIALIVCECPEETIKELYNNGKLDFYVARIIINQSKSNTSPFYKMYRKFIEEYSEIEWEETETNNRKIIERHNRNVRKAVDESMPCHEEVEQEFNERLIREELEDYTLGEIEKLPFPHGEFLKLYKDEGTYEGMKVKTTIPRSTCFKSVQRAMELLRKKIDTSNPKPLFTKEELAFIQK